jgi:hypothetical protein
MRTYSGQMEHPNCKRGKIVELLRSYKKNDIVASVFNTNNDAIRGFPSANGQYMETLRRSCCCVNISGRRRSVAYRFIDSLLSGAAVVTDNLAIRWHTDFNDYEVMQIGELGYECDKDINWMEIKEKMWQIYSSTCKRNNVSDAICNDYHNKWSPYAFARYIVKECRMELSKKEEIA